MFLSHFLIFGLVVIGLLFLFCVYERTSIFQGFNSHGNLLNSDRYGGMTIRCVYFILLFALAWAGLYMVKSYMYPSSQKIMENADCHVLSHKGFEIGEEEFFLANGNTSDTVGFPQIALWDGKFGMVSVNRDAIHIKDFIEPFYYRERNTDCFLKRLLFGDEKYRLVNARIKDDVRDGITIQLDNKDYCVLNVEEDNDKYNYILTLFDDGTPVRDTSKFHANIKVGYPLMDIIANMTSVNIDETLERVFSDSYLAKEVKNDEDSRLVFVPGKSFYEMSDLKVNNKAYSLQFDTVLHDIDGCTFYSGIGKKSTDPITVKISGDSLSPSTRLLYLVPHMKQLCRINGRVFIVSALDDVDYKMKDGGYLFNIFECEDNFNHVKANFRYSSGSARDSLNFEVMDLYADGDCHSLVYANQEFNLNTRNRNDNISWIFEMTDLRESNPLKFFHLFLFVIIFVTLVGVRLLLDYCRNSRNKSLSLFELSVYTALLCLACVRFILCWRVSTFIPLEHISPDVYDVMRDGRFWNTFLLLAVPVMFIAFSYLPPDWNLMLSEWLSKFLSESKCLIFKKERRLLNMSVALLVILGVCFVFAHFGVLTRIFNIVVPIVAYFLLDLLLVRQEKDDDAKMLGFTRLLNLVLITLFLLKADGGFAAIFMLYAWLHYLVVDVLYVCKLGRYNSWIYKNVSYILSVLSVVILFFVLMFEGPLAMLLFRVLKYIGWIVIGFGLVLLVLGIVFRSKAKWLLVVTLIASGFAIGAGVVNETCWPVLSEAVSSKKHTRYRAEVQSLDGNRTIDDLISNEQFDSGSIMFIMRSAHNQWFLNQYISAGKKIPVTDRFRLQPHSVQGVTYPTQTTDVVVTRYILAEHGESTVVCLLLMFVLLVLVYVAEVQMTGNSIDIAVNRSALGGLLLIYAIALTVFLSATNRIVFVGQDFPFVSVQSLVAVLYPMLLMILPALRTQIVRRNHQRISDSDSNSRKGLVLIIILIAFTVISMTLIERKGKDQNEDQFNVSNLVARVSDKTKIIDERFVEYQMANPIDSLKKLPAGKVWEGFTTSDYASVLNNQTLVADSFYVSLLEYFNERQANKTDPNEFLHLRRRNGICHLTVNKQHFFIPAIMGDSMHWRGNLLATEVKDSYMLSGTTENNSIKLEDETDCQLNILPVSVRKVVPGVNLYHFGKDWTPSNKPLVLLSSKRSESLRQYFSVISDSMEYVGSGKDEQIAMALSWGDNFIIYHKQNGKPVEVAFSRGLKERNDNYLAYNVCLNGKQQLFYPLGKESMWSYHIANLMSDVYGKNAQYRDSTIRLSIDFDLHKKFYNLVSEEVRRDSRPVLSKTLRNEMSEFRYMRDKDQCNPNLRCVYYDKADSRLHISKSGNKISGLKQAVEYVNKKLKKYKNEEAPLSNALDDLLEEDYDFSTVVIDGDGKIRLLFDYSRKRNIDPNNVFHMNKLISELYSDGMVADERDIFGNKALQYIPMGPASSFKPIAYSAITSQDNIGWETINVSLLGQEQAMSKNQNADNNSGVVKYSYYGGVDVLAAEGADLSIDGGYGLNSNTYLMKSDNLYHSVMIMLGMQPAGRVKDVMMESVSSISPELRFPTFSHNGRQVCFDKNVWFKDGMLNLPDNSIFCEGLWKNFHIQQSTVRLNESSYANYFGEADEIKTLFEQKGANKGWSFPEISTQNTEQRKVAPQIRNGFNQVLLGADPLKVTPLQMAMNAYRLVTLNAADGIFSLLDAPEEKRYEFFDIGDNWLNNDRYVQFMAHQVWPQLALVPTLSGTAKQLSDYTRTLRSKGLYLYSKTGTLNDTRKEAQNDRIKHLMVVISNRQLESIQTVEELKSVKFYVIYISYLGIDKADFSTAAFKPYIEATVNSDVFKSYMK